MKLNTVRMVLVNATAGPDDNVELILPPAIVKSTNITQFLRKYGD